MKISLDFNISSPQERVLFLNTYINKSQTYSNDNLEMMANYILWAVEKETSEKFQIESKNSPWSKQEKHISYEQLLDQENETGKPCEIYLSELPPLVKKQKIDRQEIINILKIKPITTLEQNLQKLNKNPDEIFSNSFIPSEWNSLAPAWFNLWLEIDTIEFMVQFWEMLHKKRREDLPIRKILFDRLRLGLLFQDGGVSFATFLDKLKTEGAAWDAHTYLKNKRKLVGLRTQQYLLIDSTKNEQMQTHKNTHIYFEQETNLIEDLAPFSDTSMILDTITEGVFTKKFQLKCVENLRKCDTLDTHSNNIIDMRQPDTVRQLLFFEDDIKRQSFSNNFYKQEIAQKILKFLYYYIKKSNFNEELTLILNMKMQKINNKVIAEKINNKFNTKYNENYISTIFTKRIIKEITKQAKMHYQLIEYITIGKTIFKKCSMCGQWLPRSNAYYNKRTSTSDGFFSYCKNCKKGK